MSFDPRHVTNFCISIVSSFSWDRYKSQGKIKTVLMKIFGGPKKSIMVFLILANCHLTFLLTFFRLLYAIVKIAFITAKIIASFEIKFTHPLFSALS